jgi:hypothetical protein
MNEDKKTRGFGVPNITGPHHFVVRVPSGRNDPVTILENYGCNGPTIDSKPLERVIMTRDSWRTIAEPLKNYLNRRLKEKGFKVSRFSAGDNMVERLLGHEICVLAWAIEDANEDEAREAFTRWASYRPEEMHWLYQQIVQDAGKPSNEARGWRLAIKQALIVKEDLNRPRRAASKSPTKLPTETTAQQTSLFID